MDEPAAPEVAGLLQTGDVAMTALNLAEVRDKLQRVGGADPVRLDEAIEQLRMAGLAVVPLDPGDGLAAGRLRATEYHRTDNAISLADCVLLACASRYGAAVA